jgi:hypothetical protein
MGDAATAATRAGRAVLAASLAAAGLGGCSVPDPVNPVLIWNRISGADDAKRPTPPGLERPFPSLGSVPARPDRPSTASRDAISAALAADRARSRDPVALRPAPGGGDAGGGPAAAGVAAGPPARASLAAAPRIPWTDTPAPAQPAAGGNPGRAAPPVPDGPPPRPQVPEVPDAAPAPPPPDLLGAPPPAPDLAAPPAPALR